MPKQQKYGTSDSDSDAPETVQLVAAKDSVLERERAVKNFHTSTAKRRKELNKARELSRKTVADERQRKLDTTRLQARTSTSNTSSTDVSGSPADLRSHQRMAQAMQDAEMEGPGSSGSSASSTSESESEAGENDLSSGSDDSDAAQHGHDHAQRHLLPSKFDPPLSLRAKLPTSSAAKSYLPDEVFARAKAEIDAHKAKLETIEEQRRQRAAEQAKGGKRKKAKSSVSSKLAPKEMVVGSTIVRALAPVLRNAPAPPSGSLEQFMKRSRSKSKGRFERRSMNLALSAGRRGPALKFTRRH